MMTTTTTQPVPDSETPARGAVLQVNGATKRFRRTLALQECSFELRPGTVTALVGPNGAGKSTLMQAIAGLVQLTDGQIRILGRQVDRAPAHPSLGYLAQDKPLFHQYDVRTMVSIARHLNARWDQEFAERLCAEAHLDPKTKIRNLSGGQRTRLALTLVLARRPDLIVLDEPLADLDPLARREVQQSILSEVAERGATVLLSSHIVTEIEDTCDRLLVLTGGRIALGGAPDDLVDRHLLLTGSADDAEGYSLLPSAQIVDSMRLAGQQVVLVDGQPAHVPAGWTATTPTLDEVVIARLRAARHAEGA